MAERRRTLPARFFSAGTLDTGSHWASERVHIIALFVLSLLVRIPLAAATTDLAPAIEDERHYLALAANLRDGHGFGPTPDTLTSIRPPLYPLFIATTWTAVGDNSLAAVRGAHVLVAIAGTLLVYRIGRLWFDGLTAFVAASAFALYPSLLFSGVLMLTETLFTTLLIAMVWAFARFERAPSHRLAVAAGLALGLAALTRSVLWPFVVILVAAVWLVTSHVPQRRRLTLSAAAFLGYLVVVGPWAARNTMLQGTLTIVDTIGGLNLMMGNYAYTPEDRMWDAVGLTGEQAWHHALPATAPDGGPWTEGKKERWAQRQAIAYIVQNPGVTARRALLKFADFWGLERDFLAGVQRGYYRPPAFLAVGIAALVTISFVLTAVLAAFGICLAPPHRAAHFFLIAIVAIFCGVHTVIFGHSRYHLPLVPVLLLYAAAACTSRAWLRIAPLRAASVGALALSATLVLIWAREILVRDWDKIRGLVGGPS